MTKLTQTSWLGGQMDVRMTGRQDMANYRNGASVLKNFVPVKLGSVRKRPGTDLVADLTDWVGGHEFRMIPFGYLGGEGYVLVLCPGATGDKARAYRAKEAVAGDGSTAAGSGSFFPVSGRVPYSEDELGEIGYVQCGDVLFLAHKNHPPSKIEHRIERPDGQNVQGEHSFACAEIDFNPARTRPTIDEITMTRQYFEDFTFSPEDQKFLDKYVSYMDEDNWHKGEYWYDKYHEIYDDPQRRKPSGTTTVKYKASLMVDGLEGPLSDEKSISFTSPWTESQVVKITAGCETIPDGKNVRLRLYKQNGGVYGLIGQTDEPSRTYNGKISVIESSYATSAYFEARTVVDGVESKYKSISIGKDVAGRYEFEFTFECDYVFPSGRDCAIRVYFSSNEVGRELSLVKEIVVPDRLSFKFTDDNIAPDTSETPIDESDGLPFSGKDEYPGSVGLYQQRLVWAGSWEDPARIWMSRAGDLYEHRPHVKLQLDDAIDFILPITQFANINFIIELGRLFVFSEGAELMVGSASTTQGISYETIMATEHSHLGCTKRLPPIVANNTLLFVNRTGQSVRDYDEELGSQRFGGKDVSVFSARIFADNPIVDWTWQQEPNSTVWCVLKDGRLASFTYDKEQKIAAWAVHELGGNVVGGVKERVVALGIAKTCAVFGRDAAHPTTGEIMVAVERGEGEARRVTLERMRPWGAADGAEADRLCMDCCTDDAGKGFPGMHMVDADGGYVYGFPFESVMTTMPPMIGDQGGASQFDVKLGQHAHLRTVGSRGGEIYAVGMRNQPSKIDEWTVRDGEDGAEFRDVDVVLAGSNNRDGRVTVRHDGPWPFQLALLELDYEVEN